MYSAQATPLRGVFYEVLAGASSVAREVSGPRHSSERTKGPFGKGPVGKGPKTVWFKA